MIDPGYYVSVIDPKTRRGAIVDGPHETHAEALGRVALARATVLTKYPWTESYTFGTCLVKKTRPDSEYTKTELL